MLSDPSSFRPFATRFAAALLGALLTGHAVARAAAAERPALPCSPEGAQAVRVGSVAEDFTLHLADGRTVVLAGIDPVRNTADHPRIAAEARAAVEAWLRGRDVLLQPAGAGADRWDRWPGLVFAGTDAAPEPPQLSVSLALVDAGLARARPEPPARACWASLLAGEARARAAGLGLWADPYYAVREASDEGLAAITGALALVEGRVTRVGQGRSRLYIGLDGPAADFSLRLGKREAAALFGPGGSAERWKGLRVRVRGFLDDRFGLGMDIAGDDQVEILDERPSEAEDVAGRAERVGRDGGPGRF